MADLHTVRVFISNGDAHARFLEDTSVAVFEEALALRENPTTPATAESEAAQRWALRVFDGPMREARRMLPALAIKANDAGLIDDNGVITYTDAQMRSVVGSLVGVFAGYVEEAV